MPRSLASVYGGAVTRFLGGGGLRGVVSRVIDMPGISGCNGMAVTRDGSTLLVSTGDPFWTSRHGIHEFAVADGSPLRVVGEYGDSEERLRLQLDQPHQVWIASDDNVFIADCGNGRVQVLSPDLDHHWRRPIGGGLIRPVGVCANADVVVVCEYDPANRTTA
jgi:sugar lactone lactonase YvrE